MCLLPAACPTPANFAISVKGTVQGYREPIIASGRREATLRPGALQCTWAGVGGYMKQEGTNCDGSGTLKPCACRARGLFPVLFGHWG